MEHGWSLAGVVDDKVVDVIVVYYIRDVSHSLLALCPSFSLLLRKPIGSTKTFITADSLCALL